MNTNIGIIGLGDMGIGMAQNIVGGGFTLYGFDVREERRALLRECGGHPVDSLKELAEHCDIVFIMVLNGVQVHSIVSGAQGIAAYLKRGSTIVVTATILPSEIRSVESSIDVGTIGLLDCPVSGGKSGADSGALTLMPGGKKDVLERCRPVLQSISKTIHHVGENVGDGQTMKAALQSLMGCSFVAIFESLVLGAKAGLDMQKLYEVFGDSAVGGPLFKNAAKLIMERKFKGTGSHIGTMHKDLGITMNVAKELGVPMFATSTAYELFQAGMSTYPGEDNWCIVKLLEGMANTTVEARR